LSEKFAQTGPVSRKIFKRFKYKSTLTLFSEYSVAFVGFLKENACKKNGHWQSVAKQSQGKRGGREKKLFTFSVFFAIVQCDRLRSVSKYVFGRSSRLPSSPRPGFPKKSVRREEPLSRLTPHVGKKVFLLLS